MQRFNSKHKSFLDSNLELQSLVNEFIKKYSYAAQASDWLDFYTDPKLYGFSKTQIEDLLCHGSNAKTDKLQLIVSPKTNLTQDLKVAQSLVSFSGDDSLFNILLYCYDPIWKSSKDRIMFIHALNFDQSASRDGGLIRDYDSMKKAEEFFMDFRSALQFIAFKKFIKTNKLNTELIGSTDFMATTSLVTAIHEIVILGDGNYGDFKSICTIPSDSNFDDLPLKGFQEKQKAYFRPVDLVYMRK